MKRIPWINIAAVLAVVVAAMLIVARNVQGDVSHQLLNVSYDPTRELYRRLADEFAADYRKRTGRQIEIKQSHGGSSRQARAVVDGQLPADVVTLGLYSDIDVLRKRGLIAEGWSKRLPNNSQPYTSTIVFVVRKGNPKHIRDWPDLVAPGIEIVTPDPRTSGNGKLSALAAWGAIVSRGGTEAQAQAYLKSFYANAPILDQGARGAAVTFAIEKIGDVHLTWENEALREVAETKDLEIVYPPVSILAEPYVAWVDANVARSGNEAEAKAFLEFLFTARAQDIIAEFGYRPARAESAAKFVDRLPRVELFSIGVIAQDWDDAERKFFAPNGIIDTVYTPKPKPISE